MAEARRRRGRGNRRLERDAPIGRGLAQRDAEPGLRARGERVAARRLAGFGAAELEHVAAGRLAAEVMIEGDDAMDLGAREVERRRDQGHGGLGDIAELLLQRVQDRQHRAIAMPMLGDDLARMLAVPGRVVAHSIATPRQ